MNNRVHILPAKNAFAALLLLLAIVMAFLAPRAAVNVDEQLHYPHAKKILSGCLYFCHMQNLIYVIFPIASIIKKENALNKV